LRVKIERAEENLALAESDEDFTGIQKHITKWRAQRDDLAEAIDQQRATVRITPAATAALSLLDEAIESLATADRVPLRDAISAVVKRVQFSRNRTYAEVGICSHRGGKPNPVEAYTFSGSIEFVPGLLPVDKVEFENELFGQDPRWYEAAMYVCQAGRIVSTREASEHVACYKNAMVRMLKRASAAGLVKWVGHKHTGGWVTPDLPEEYAVPSIIQDVVDFVIDAGRPVTPPEVSDALGISRSATHGRIREARRTNLLRCADRVKNRFASLPTEAAIVNRQQRDRCAEIVNNAAKPLGLGEVAEQLGVSENVARWWLTCAEAAELVNQSAPGLWATRKRKTATERKAATGRRERAASA